MALLKILHSCARIGTAGHLKQTSQTVFLPQIRAISSVTGQRGDRSVVNGRCVGRCGRPRGLTSRPAVCSVMSHRGLSTTHALGSSLIDMHPHDFLGYLKEKNIQRCFLVYDQDENKIKASHPELQELADYFQQDKIDFREHEGVFLTVGQRTQCLLGAFVWRTARGQAVSFLTLFIIMMIGTWSAKSA